ncbi:unnamed protein product [Protopolystoma xenopodis]|uniref:Uncharacterized protein n=1 Tax=Protopolystoma xenopodis TaxID=117903 RepID=A0A448WJW4_9PLAT|nr:unnamed protein product [Protopolystoma xenopodis]
MLPRKAGTEDDSEKHSWVSIRHISWRDDVSAPVVLLLCRFFIIPKHYMRRLVSYAQGEWRTFSLFSYCFVPERRAPNRDMFFVLALCTLRVVQSPETGNCDLYFVRSRLRRRGVQVTVA